MLINVTEHFQLLSLLQSLAFTQEFIEAYYLGIAFPGLRSQASHLSHQVSSSSPPHEAKVYLQAD